MELGWKAADPPRDRESVALKPLRNDLELFRDRLDESCKHHNAISILSV